MDKRHLQEVLIDQKAIFQNKTGIIDRDLLLDRYGISPGPSLRYTLFTEDINGEPKEQSKKGRYCTFYAKDWLSNENYDELMSDKVKE